LLQWRSLSIPLSIILMTLELPFLWIIFTFSIRLLLRILISPHTRAQGCPQCSIWCTIQTICLQYTAHIIIPLWGGGIKQLSLLSWLMTSLSLIRSLPMYQSYRCVWSKSFSNLYLFLWYCYNHYLFCLSITIFLFHVLFNSHINY